MSQCTNRDLPTQVGRYLKQTLIARGITQEQFAELAHVSDRTVRRWVSGEIHSLDALSDIANALQVEVRDIFTEDVPLYFHSVDIALNTLKLQSRNLSNRTYPVLFFCSPEVYNNSTSKRKEECEE